MYSYQPIQAKPFYCLPACLEIILKSIGVLASQDYFGEQIGIETASEKDLKLGTNVQLSALNNIARLLNLEYFFTYLRAAEFEEWMFEEKLAALLQQGDHVICTLSAGRLYKNSDLELGHAVVVKKLEAERVEIVDPGPKDFGFKTYSLEQLYVASRYREGGLLVLSKKAYTK